MYWFICGCLVSLIWVVSAYAYDLTVNVSASTDDAIESNIGIVTTDGVSMTLEGLQWGCGIRFLNVTIPQGATIDDAVLYIAYGPNCTATCYNDAFGVDIDDSSTFGSGNKPSAQTKTTATEPFDKTGTLPGDSQYLTANIDITAITQEIVNREGWVSGNAMSFVIDVDSYGKGSSLTIYAYDHADFPEAELRVNYTSAGVRRVFTTH